MPDEPKSRLQAGVERLMRRLAAGGTADPAGPPPLLLALVPQLAVVRPDAPGTRFTAVEMFRPRYLG